LDWGPLLALLFFLAFFCVLFQANVFQSMSFVRRDIQRFYYPMWLHGTESLRSGTIPLWNPYINFGQPFLANLQTCVFYPLRVLFFLPDFTWAFNFYIVLHLVLSGYFTALWTRGLKLSWASALLAGLAFSLSAYMISTINLTISLCAASYFPLVLLCFRKALQVRGFFWKSICGVCLFFQYLAGDPSISIATLLVLTIFTLYRVFLESFKTRRLVLNSFWSLSQTGGVLILLSAFQSLLFSEFILRSTRTTLSAASQMMWSMRYNDFAGLVIPFFSDLSIKMMDYDVRQSWLDNYYVGVSVVLLAGIAVLFRRRSTIVGYHILLALLGIGLVLGPFSLAYPGLQKVFPILNFIRYPIRFFFIFTFSMACLAGFGFETLLTKASKDGHETSGGSKGKRRVFWWVLLLLILSWAVFLFALNFEALFSRLDELLNARFDVTIKKIYQASEFTDLVYTLLSNVKRSILFFGLTFFGVLMAYRSRISRSLLSVYFILLVAVDLAMANLVEPTVRNGAMTALVPSVRQILKDPPPRLFRILASPRIALFQDSQWGRSASREFFSTKNNLAPNLTMMYKFYDCMGYDSIHLSDVSKIQWMILMLRPALENKGPASRDFQLDGPLLGMLNVKYFSSTSPKLPGRFQKIISLKRGRLSVSLYRNPNLFPRAFLVKNCVFEKEIQVVYKNIFSKDFDPTKTVYLDERPTEVFAQNDSKASATDTVSILEYEPQRIKMRARVNSADRWLFLSDTYYPGWKAWVDGKSTKIYKANCAFRAIHLQPGDHEILWRYDPILFKIGSAITLMTIFGLGVYHVRRRNALV